MFRVEWIQAALDELTELWLRGDAVFRQAVTSATNELDRELAMDPFRESESREEGIRVQWVHPLGINIQVDKDSGMVWVVHVWRIHRRK